MTYTLDHIVKQTLLKRGYPIHWYAQFLFYGVACLRELEFDTLQNIKTVRLTVTDNKVTLPADCVDVVKVGVEDGIYVINSPHKDTFSRLYESGEVSNDVVAFKYLRESGKIIITTEATEVYVEYITDGTSIDSTTTIHPYALSTIEAYIVWQLRLHNRSYNLGERAEGERIYYNELRKLRARLNPMTKEDILQSLRNHYTLAIKN